MKYKEDVLKVYKGKKVVFIYNYELWTDFDYNDALIRIECYADRKYIGSGTFSINMNKEIDNYMKKHKGIVKRALKKIIKEIDENLNSLKKKKMKYSRLLKEYRG